MSPPAADSLPVRRTTEVVAELVPPAGRRVVDVGCGDGGLVRFLAEHGAEAIGVEVQHAALLRAQAAAPADGAHYVVGRAGCLPFRDRSVDAVIYLNSLHHVPGEDRWPALAEARRVLAPAGRLLVIEPLAEGAYFELVRPVEDETAVRAEAHAEIRRAPALGLAPVRQLFYRSRLRFRGFDAFAERLAQVDPRRRERLAAMRPALERAFAERATREPGGAFAFDQPMRADLLSAPGG